MVPSPSTAVLVVAALVLFAFGTPAEAAIPCTVVNEALPLANDTVDSSCTNITFANVTASGNMVSTINLTATLLANPTAPTVMVSIANLSLSAGATKRQQ
jgi:hypothetical protein